MSSISTSKPKLLQTFKCSQHQEKNNANLFWCYGRSKPQTTSSPKGTINCPLHKALLYPRCPGCPSQGVKLKTGFNCVKMVMFHAMIFVMGEANSSLYIHSWFRGNKYKWHHQSCLGSHPHPNKPKMAKIATNTMHLFSLKVYVIWTKKYLLYTISFSPRVFLATTKNYGVQINAFSPFFNEGVPL